MQGAAARSLQLIVVLAAGTAFNGQTSIEVTQQADPEICILEINMPGMNGYELARRIRESAREPPPVVATVTACGDAQHLDRAADAGFDLAFTRPADVFTKIDQLERCLNR